MWLSRVDKLAKSGNAKRYLFHAIRGAKAYRNIPDTECSICGYTGKFMGVGVSVRFGALCPNCLSLERHRLFALASARGFLNFSNAAILHFAPEASVRKILDEQKPASYVTADICPGRADLVLDIEQLDFPSSSVDVVICAHVLEHVDDGKALRELRRVVKDDGFVVLMVPIVEGWETTYENKAITSPEGRTLHFGQDDHVRYYGADFRTRVEEAGFRIEEFTAFGEDCFRYGLVRGEKVFKAVPV